MTKLVQRAHRAAASLLVPSIALLVLAASAAFPATGFAEEGPPVGPVFTLSPVSFPKTTAGAESPTETVDVYNEGDAGTWVEQIAIEGPDNASFKVTGSNCGQLEPGLHCSVWVVFTPGEAGEKQATLRLHLGNGADVTQQLAAVAAPVQLSFSPGSFDFGTQQINGRSASTTFQLTNSGEASTQVGSLGIGGRDSNEFWTGNSECWGRWLSPGESCYVEVSFGPRETVGYEALVQASAYGQTFAAELRGFGGRPVVNAYPSPADFGAVTVGETGPIQTIVVANTGNLPAGFFIGVIAGGDAGSFHLIDENCTDAPLMPSGTCTAHVRFAPQGPGPKAARLAFFGEAEGGTMVPLSGEGVAATVTLAPSGYDFGSTAVGTKSGAQSFAVRNEGGTPLDLGSVAIAGADPDQFSLAGDDCSGAVLAAGGECVARVRFVPDSAGAKTARLRIVGDAGTFTAPLAGTGTAVGSPPDAGTFAPAAVGAAFNLVASEPQRTGRRHRHRRQFGRGATLSAAHAGKPKQR